MSTDLDASFVEQYININTKLKKRFMRKPNITEATNEFNALAIQCEHSEQPGFAGHCYVGAAKCESSAGNTLGEAEYYLTAARQFMKAEMKLSSLKCYSPTRENLEAAIGAYIQAMNKYPEKSPLRTSILLELANSLVLLGSLLEALAYYQQALETMDEGNLMRVKCLSNILRLNIQKGRYDMALETADTICDSKLNIPEHTLTEIQITRILLGVLEEHAERKPSLQKLFNDLLNDNAVPFNCDLKLKLQSIVMCGLARDVEALTAVSADVGGFLTLQQRDLLNAIIRKMERNQ
ncbi:uncharacterized protein LOC105395745 [Plutella xylostella]|uniref:uncharacterized protein LOC105395745 n=1 Tax=Plutella xylostella TaxID=51655 RepID=UPI002032343E|nr:uncharacterized protein LOC105395745 [Plutella xylostella]